MSYTLDLSGRVALVTGGSKNLGRHMAEGFIAAGAKVYISSRKADACEAARDEINAAVGREAAISVPANIASKESLQALVDATVAKWGQIDHLVCNAASNPYYGPQAGISDEQFTKILQVFVIVLGPATQMPASLVWELAYAELVFFDADWHALDAEHLEMAIDDFTRRDRRFGGVDS